MRYSVAGLNFKTASPEIRGIYSVLPHLRKEIYLKTSELIDGEFLWLSTCNRTELYFAGKDRMDDKTLLKVFYNTFGVVTPAEYFYIYHDREAVKHLFEVVTGIDSLVVGEKEIVGQVKDAFKAAREFGSIGKYLDKLFSTALHINKDVRSNIPELSSPLSIPYIAIKVVRDKIGDLSSARFLILGTGAMADLVAKNIIEYGGKNIFFTSRHLNRAKNIAERWGGQYILREEAMQNLSLYDVIVIATNLKVPLITEEVYESINNVRQIIIDISIPHGVVLRRDVPGVEVIYLDDLEEVVDGNKKEREKAISEVKKILDFESVRFMGWLVEQYVAPMIEKMFERSEKIRQEMMEEFYEKNNISPELAKKIDHRTNQLVKRLIHIHLKKVRQATRGMWDDDIYHLINSIFTRYETDEHKNRNEGKSISPGSDKKG